MTVMEEYLETNLCSTNSKRGRLGGLMVSALDSGASDSGSSPGRGHCVVFLGKTVYSHSASLHPGTAKKVPAFTEVYLVENAR